MNNHCSRFTTFVCHLFARSRRRFALYSKSTGSSKQKNNRELYL